MGFTPNPVGIQALAVSPEIAATVETVAQRGREVAVALSQDFRDTGEYANSFEVTVSVRHDPVGPHPHDRAVATLRNTSGHAAAVEYGYEGRSGEPSTSAHHVLARTLDALSAE